MQDNITNAINQLQSMLSSEGGKKELENMINSFGAAPADSVPTGDMGLLGAENIMKMKSAIDTLQRHDDPRSQLLLALKPYLSNARGARIDTAIMLLSLGKLPSIMKIMRG